MQIRIKTFDPYGAPRGIAHVVKADLTRVLGEVPTGRITWLQDSPTASRLATPVEVAFEIRHDNGAWIELPDSRLRIGRIQYDRVSDMPAYSADLVGVGVSLSETTIWEPTKGNEEGKREFVAQTAGSILHTLLTESKARVSVNGLKWANGAITWRFTADRDTAGNPWVRPGRDSKATVAFDPAKPVFDVLDWLRRKGLAEWRMQGRELQVYRSDDGMATRRPGTRLRGVFSTSQPVTEDFSEIVTDARFHGDEGKTFDRAIQDTVRYFGRIERHTQQGQTSTEGTANLYLDELAAAGKRPSLQYRREWVDGTDRNEPRLGVDYELGDWVRIDPHRDDRDLRIVESHLSLSEKGQVTGFETLGTRLQSLLERLSRRTYDLSAGQVGSDSGAPKPKPPSPVRLPAPTGVLVSAHGTWYAGEPSAVATVSWTAVKGADSYEVWTDRPDYQAHNLAATTASTSANCERLPVRQRVGFRVRAVTDTGVKSPFSQWIYETMPADDDAPAAPSTPILSTEFGLLKVEWDGLLIEGQEPPPDLDHLAVFVGVDNARFEQVAQIPAGERHVWVPVRQEARLTVVLEAVDWAGNQSGWGPPAEIRVSSPLTPVLERSREYVREQIAELDKRKGTAPVFGPKISTMTTPNVPNPTEGLVYFGVEAGKIVQAFKYERGAWAALAPGKEWLPQVTVGDLVAGTAKVSQAVIDKLWAEVITARKIAAEQVEISRDGNLVVDAPITSSLNPGAATVLHQGAVRIDTPGPYVAYVRVGAGSAIYRDQYIPSDVVLLARWQPQGGKQTQFQGRRVRVPADRDVEVSVEFTADTPGSVSVWAWSYADSWFETTRTVSRVQVRPQFGSALIVTGGITADRINTQSLAADQAFVGLLDAKIVRSDMFEGRKFTGGTFTGGTFQTHEAINTGVKLTPSGLRAWDASGRKTFEIEAATGRQQLTGRYDSGLPGEPGISIIPVHESSSRDAGLFFSSETGYLPGGVTPGIWLNNPGKGSAAKPIWLRGQHGGGLHVDGRFSVNAGRPGGAGVVQLMGLEATGYAANVMIDSSDRLFRSTSAQKYKTNIQRMEIDAVRLLDLSPMTWLDRGELARYDEAKQRGEDPTYPARIPGLIAEDVQAAGLGEFVTRDADGNIEGLMYDRLWTLLLPLARRLRERIAWLEGHCAQQQEQLDALEARLTALEGGGAA